MNNEDFALAPGTVLVGARRYVIERLLGAGGFGKTYLATTTFTVQNMKVKGYVAVKEHFVSDHNEREGGTLRVTTPGTARSREIVANSLRDFLGEARRLQSLGAGHANIVSVNEVFEANNTAYYVMEYLDGSSLWKAVDGRPMAEADMLALMRPIVDAVAYLHRHRLTHLDIKPQNIMLATEGEGDAVRPVLIDFGLSKHYDAAGNATSTVNTLACSDGYSPVEQYSGITTFSPEADVYALGATMLACLTGQTPPKSTQWLAGERMRYIDTLPVSAALRTALRGALADGTQRLPDAAALLSALPSAAEASQAPERRFQSPRDQASDQAMERRFLCEQSASRLVTSAPDQAADQATPAADQAMASADQPTPAPYQATAPSTPTEPLENNPILPESTPTGKPNWLRIALFSVLLIAIFAGGIAIYQNIEKKELLEQHIYPENLYLAVERSGQQYYYSQNEWQNMPATERNRYNKLGVVIKYGSEPAFILALEDDPGEYTWQEAMNRFGSQLPTKQQGEAWISQKNVVQRAVRAFGGHMPGPNDQYYSNRKNGIYDYWYWTRTENDSSYAWDVTVGYGSVGYTNKTYPKRVRPVARVAEAAR